MTPLHVAVLVSSFVLTISVLFDINWRCFKALTCHITPAKVLMILRSIQATSAFVLTFHVVDAVLNLYFSPDPIMAFITASIAGTALTIAVGIAIYRRGTKLSLEETIEEENLRNEIREDVESAVKDAVYRVDKDVAWLRDEVKDLTEGMAEHVRGEVCSLAAELKKLESKIDQINRIVEGYNVMVRTYREEAGKREALALQIEEVTRLEEEYRRKLESLSEVPLDTSMIPELAHDKAVLTQADGLASRRKGDLSQKESAELLRGLGFEVEEYYGIGLPDYILKWLKEKVAVGAHKAFTLSREGTRQRTISAIMIKAEINAAIKYKLPLVIILTNLRNGRRWAEFIPYDKLKEFKRFTTPLILSEDSPESAKICEESILRLREILGYKN